MTSTLPAAHKLITAAMELAGHDISFSKFLSISMIKQGVVSIRLLVQSLIIAIVHPSDSLF
jgi:hypothetical protein